MSSKPPITPCIRAAPMASDNDCYRGLMRASITEPDPSAQLAIEGMSGSTPQGQALSPTPHPREHP